MAGNFWSFLFMNCSFMVSSSKFGFETFTADFTREFIILVMIIRGGQISKKLSDTLRRRYVAVYKYPKVTLKIWARSLHPRATARARHFWGHSSSGWKIKVVRIPWNFVCTYLLKVEHHTKKFGHPSSKGTGAPGVLLKVAQGWELKPLALANPLT